MVSGKMPPRKKFPEKLLPRKLPLENKSQENYPQKVPTQKNAPTKLLSRKLPPTKKNWSTCCFCYRHYLTVITFFYFYTCYIHQFQRYIYPIQKPIGATRFSVKYILRFQNRSFVSKSFFSGIATYF